MEDRKKIEWKKVFITCINIGFVIGLIAGAVLLLNY